MPETLEEILNREFGQPVGIQRKQIVLSAIQTADSERISLERFANRLRNRAVKANMIGAVSPDDIQAAYEKINAAHNLILEVMDDLINAGDIWGVTDKEVADVLKANETGTASLDYATSTKRPTAMRQPGELLNREMLLADDPKQIAPEDVPGYPHK